MIQGSGLGSPRGRTSDNLPIIPAPARLLPRQQSDAAIMNRIHSSSKVSHKHRTGNNNNNNNNYRGNDNEDDDDDDEQRDPQDAAVRKARKYEHHHRRKKTKKTERDSLTRPNAHANIACVCKVIQRHIAMGDGGDQEENGRVFELENYVEPEFKTLEPVQPHCHSLTLFMQDARRVKLPKPSVKNIFMLVKRVFDEAHLNPECCIIALIYVERLMERKAFSLNRHNWIPIVLMALLTASKVWDDLSSWNVEFSEIYPILSLRVVNHLEREFLAALEYNLYISASLYAKYYFALRALRSATKPRNIPKRYLQTQVRSSAVNVAAQQQQRQQREQQRAAAPRAARPQGPNAAAVALAAARNRGRAGVGYIGLSHSLAN